MKRLVTFFTLLALVLAVSCAQVYAAQKIETISVFTAGPAGVTEDGLSLNIAEDYVNSEEDWADEEKIETRTIQIEIPAAG